MKYICKQEVYQTMFPHCSLVNKCTSSKKKRRDWISTYNLSPTRQKLHLENVIWEPHLMMVVFFLLFKSSLKWDWHVETRPKSQPFYRSNTHMHVSVPVLIITASAFGSSVLQVLIQKPGKFWSTYPMSIPPWHLWSKKSGWSCQQTDFSHLIVLFLLLVLTSNREDKDKNA